MNGFGLIECCSKSSSLQGSDVNSAIAMTIKPSQRRHEAPTSCICQKEDCRTSFPSLTIGAALWLHAFVPRRAGSPLGKTAVVACVELSTVHVAKVDSYFVSSRGSESVSHWIEETPPGSDQLDPTLLQVE